MNYILRESEAIYAEKNYNKCYSSMAVIFPLKNRYN